MNFSSPILGRVAPKGREPSLSGDMWSRWTLVSEVPGQSGGQSQRLWNCICECGTPSKVFLGHLKSGRSASCGCLRLERNVETKTTHGLSRSRTYMIWGQMVQRTLNPNHKDYADYGGRDVNLDPSWLQFSNFLADMGECPEGRSIDRIDNNLGYSPLNCRYADSKTQARNKRNNIRVVYKDQTLCLKEACETSGLSYGTAQARITRYGWSISRALGPEFSDPT